MPKTKKKKGKAPAKPGVAPPQAVENPTLEDDDQLSNMSVDSFGNTSLAESSIAGAIADLDEESAQVLLEDRVITALDQCNEKNNNTRLKGLEALRKMMQHHVILLGSAWSHTETMFDCLERTMKRGKTSGEQVLAAKCLPLFVCQNESGELLQSERLAELLSLSRKIMTDKSANTSVRCVCANNIAFLYFMRSHNIQSELEESMRMLEDVFCASNASQVADLCLAALQSWMLLMVISHRSQFARITTQVTPQRLPALLSNSDVRVRIAAGEAIAVVCERLREGDDEEQAEQEVSCAFPNFAEMVTQLEELAKDNAKCRAKSDLKQQRSSFREVLATVRDNTDPSAERVRFGEEEISLDYWLDRRVYSSFCEIFGGGMNAHLRENPIVREAFNLGAPLPVLAPGEKRSSNMNRHQRRLANQAVAKERIMRRQQHRDKRFVY